MSEKMKRVILASHGSLAEGMLSAVKMILGNDGGCQAYGLDTYEEPKKIYELIESEIKKEPNTQFIVITDINGGSVQNQLLQLCAYENVYVQTGMCLAMVLEIILFQEEKKAEEFVPSIVKTASASMYGFSKNTIQQAKIQLTEEEEIW